MQNQPYSHARAKITKTPDGVYMVIPAPRRWVPTYFTGLWLCGWFFGELVGGAMLFSFLFTADFSFATVFVLFWLTGWTFAGTMAMRAFLWGLLGYEEIIATKRYLSIKHSVRLWSKEQNVDIKDVSNLRVDSPDSFLMDDARSGQAVGPGKNGAQGRIRFEAGSTHHGFGVGLNSVEATAIVGDINQVFQA